MSLYLILWHGVKLRVSIYKTKSELAALSLLGYSINRASVQIHNLSA